MEHSDEAIEIANEMDSIIQSALVFQAHPMHRQTEMFFIDDEEEENKYADELMEMAQSFHSIAPHSDSIVEDCPEFRTELPVLRDMSIQPAQLWSAIKNLVGKDLTKQSLPVFINEPVTTL